ncbi:SDR family oxidoreductase, partial [Nostoc sp. NIES-2111]
MAAGHLVDLGLEGRGVLVVGAARGIGQATAVQLSRAGARVVLADRDDCAETAAACDGNPVLERLDLSEPSATEALMRRHATEQAPLYGLVNCAGLLLRRPLEETSVEDIERQIAVNQVGTFYLARAALAHMQAQGEGRIVLFTSQGAFTGGFFGSIPYAMTKAAVTALVKSFARIGAPSGVTVNAVAPGAADTAMFRGGMSAEDIANFTRQIPMGRVADPV